MIMMADKKKAIIGILGPREEEKEAASPPSDFDMIKDDLMSAINAKDSNALLDALKAFHYAHHAEMAADEGAE